jgi:translation initiation factor IF-3
MIRVPQVRLVGQDGDPLGIRPTSEALQIAEEAALDLVEVAPNADPPVCRVMDYGKFKYEKSKKDKEARKKQHVVHLKEVKFRPKTGEHDYQYKMEHAREFLLRNDRVKATVIFRGREITHLEFGERILEKLVEDLSDIAQLEMGRRREGRTLVSVFVPDKDKVRLHLKALEQKKKEEAKAAAAAASSEAPAADGAAVEEKPAVEVAPHTAPADDPGIGIDIVGDDPGKPKPKRRKKKEMTPTDAEAPAEAPAEEAQAPQAPETVEKPKARKKVAAKPKVASKPRARKKAEE